MATPNRTAIPEVPLRTPMFDGKGNLTRTWIIFFERLTQSAIGPFKATLDVKDTTVGNNIADVVPVMVDGMGVRILAVLRKAIAADLTVRINKGPDVITMTIPHATAPFALLTQDISSVKFLDSQVITWDILASDGSKDADGVASFLVEWA